LVRRRHLILLDEPLSSVDARLRSDLRGEIARTVRSLEALLVFVTHDQLDALSIADRIAVLRGGRVEQFGSPDDLYDRPATTFVAQFVGLHGTNLFEGRVADRDGHPWFVSAHLTLPIPAAWLP